MPETSAFSPAPSVTAVTIRRAIPDDARTVAAMVREIAAHEGHSDQVHVIEAQWRALLARADVIVLLAEREGSSIGYVSAVRQLHLWSAGDILALDDLYVRPGHRDGGVGQQLMGAMAAIARPDQLTIRWGVEADNVSGQRFYRRLGAALRPKVTATWSPSAYSDLDTR
jgi:ribosomal protein S18 acetylase RimI-like enzyme